ncbi:MAG: Wzz/FepE/Etk N-terminal domain-containing protein, partial [Deltaproteobacteria bacterium]|nr:Wzz/FepE/Etk N-terminal domain-containing protein [Deltaproteobacteria bacterium]
MADKRREEEVDLLDYWQVAAKHKKLIGIITSIAFAASIIAGLLLPTLYAATASVMPPQQDDLMGSAIASKLPSGLSGLAGGLLGTKSPSDLWVGILKSRTVRDGIIEKFN